MRARKSEALVFVGLLLMTQTAAQVEQVADSIRKAYSIPELGYAVVTGDEVLQIHVLGVKRWGSTQVAEQNDRFRIGSNTKAITGFIAAQLVKQGKIAWDTRFFDLFPELKAQSQQAYHHITLLDLLSFRTRLLAYTYTHAEPTREQFTGDDAAQRLQFVTWFLGHEPVPQKKGVQFSNVGYVAAGLMLEKVSGKPYTTLVRELGDELGIDFGYGAPNATDSLQPWGHDAQLMPEPPGDAYKLNWLLPAGNINASLPQYVRFIQEQLQGFAGRSPLLSAKEFRFLLTGRERFAVGWFWEKGADGELLVYNIGNPGSFLTKVYLFPDKDRAYILFSNAQTPQADEGLDALFQELRGKYGP